MNELDIAKPTLRQDQERILDRALAAFTAATGLPARVEARKVQVPGGQLDAIVTIGDKVAKCTFAAEIRRVDRFGTIAAARDQFAHIKAPHPGLLVAPYIPMPAAEYCRKVKLAFLDAAGNAYLEQPGLFVFIKGAGKPPQGEFAAQGRAATGAALRVMFALLCNPALFNAPYRQIAQAAGVALGTVGAVFVDLDARHLTTGGKQKESRRVLLEPKRLLDEWTVNYPISLRPKLHRQRFTAQEKGWWKGIDIQDYGGIWGGEVAADRYTQNLRPATITIYIDPGDARKNIRRLIAENRLRPDAQGEVEILDRFWHFDTDEGTPETPKAVVPPLLIYADLMASLDPRNTQVARAIHEQWLANARATA